MKISVIIPTYNGERTLERAIKSVLIQRFDVEILICDDCSTDSTLDIAKKYGCRILQNEVNSGGPNKGRNIGIRNATGDYLAFLDQDDEWLPDKLNIQLIDKSYEFIYSSYIKKEE